MMDSELKRDIILDNYQNPANKMSITDEDYIKVNSNNSSCIDNIDLWIKFKNNIIEDIKFDGEACAISTASSSIMTKELVGKTIEEAEDYIKKFYYMIETGESEEDFFKEAIAFDTIYKQSNRKTCATLPYKGILDAIEKYKSDNR